MAASAFHRMVVEDVIKNMRAEFASEGLDEQVVEDLKQLWESKLMTSGVYDFPQNAVQPAYTYDNLNYTYMDPHAQQQALLAMPQQYNMAPYVAAPANRPTRPNNAAHMVAMNALASLNSPSATAHPSPHPSHPSAHPSSHPQPALQPASLGANQYGYDSTGKPQQYMAPPGSLAGWNAQANANTQYMTNIRQHDGANDEVDEKQERQKIDKKILKKYKRVQRQQKLLDKAKANNAAQPSTTTETIPQFDGLGDRKTEGDELDDEDDDEEENKPAGDEELGSDDDDDSEDEEEPDTEHIVLCQYEKVSRVKNKRKANLKDGMMHINGRDYVFSKATGEFDW